MYSLCGGNEISRLLLKIFLLVFVLLNSMGAAAKGTQDIKQFKGSYIRHERPENEPKIFVYDPGLDEWQYASDTETGVRQAQMVSFKNILYLIGGVGDETILSFCIEGEVIEKERAKR